MESLLITGSKGFIGRHLAKKLHRDFFLQTLNRGDGQDIAKKRAFSSLKPASAVIHLAAFTSTVDSFKKKKECFRVNVEGTRNVLEFCRKYGSHLIFASTYLYGEPKYLPIDENHPISLDSPYKESKFEAEKLCLSYAKKYDIKISILRQFNIFGPGQDESFLIPRIISQLKSGSIVLNDSTPKRDFLYITDLIEAYQKLLKRIPKGAEVYNIGSGTSHSVEEIANLIVEISNKNIPITYLGTRRKNEIMNVRADITKIRKELNWAPKVSLEQGLRSMLE